jgi:hypothetical protein
MLFENSAEVPSGLERHPACIRLAGSALPQLPLQVATLSLPEHVARLLRDALAALDEALAAAAGGHYARASAAAQRAHAWAEVAFGDPALSERLNVPDTHYLGVYLPFCLPAVVPLAQAVAQEARRALARLKRRKAASA